MADVSEKAAQERPPPGSRWTDDDGRTLVAEVVEPGDPLGREVRGQVFGPDTQGWRNYTCTLAQWAETWRPKGPDNAP